MAEPKILTPAVLTTHALPFTTNANNLMEQAERAEIVATEDFDRAVDHIKICQAQHTSAEEARKNLTAPLNNHVKWINAQFKPITDRLTAAKDAMKAKAATWKVAEDKRIQEEEERLRKEAEDQALKDAQEAADAGDDAKAEAIMTSAADTPEAKGTAPTGRGTFTGASGGIRKTWSGEVVDVKLVCAAICDGVLPEEIIKQFSQLELNKYAKAIKVESTTNGIKITERKDMAVR
jgi:hypothetical protein